MLRLVNDCNDIISLNIIIRNKESDKNVLLNHHLLDDINYSKTLYCYTIKVTPLFFTFNNCLAKSKCFVIFRMKTVFFHKPTHCLKHTHGEAHIHVTLHISVTRGS